MNVVGAFLVGFILFDTTSTAKRVSKDPEKRPRWKVVLATTRGMYVLSGPGEQANPFHAVHDE